MIRSLLRDWLHPRSVRGRLALAFCVLLPVILGLTALILEQAFNRSLEASIRERLRLQTYVLLGAAEAGGGELWMPPVLDEPRFGQPGSGLFGVVTDRNGDVLWRSPSTLGIQLDINDELTDIREPHFNRTANERFFFSHPVIWVTEDGRQTPFVFIALESPSFYEAEIGAFRLHLWLGLGGLALGLLISQLFILRWGLRPLSQLAQDLAAIEQGQAERLRGHYPKEVEAVTDNLNTLLDSERRHRERYRNTLSDLAHSLKTPLSVLRNQADEHQDASLSEQVDRMDQIVSHQLGRASSVSAHRLLQPVDIKATAERLCNALSKVYRDKQPVYEVRGEAVHFQGDERDLMELLGNLLDNAFKYGAGRVRVECARQGKGALEIRISDDGAGVPEAIHPSILQRGTRADSLQPGQGIGLSVVMDILSGYEGKLRIAQSTLGGACFIVELPV